MKYKIIDGSTIKLAGIAQYETVSDSKKSSGHRKKGIEFDFPEIPPIDLEAIKEEAKRLANEAKKIKFDFKHNKDSAETNEEDKSYERHNFDFHFETPNSELLQSISRSMKDFGKTIEKQFEQWGKDFSESFDEQSEENFQEVKDRFQEQFDNYCEEINKHWQSQFSSEDYGTWELEALFNELYNQSPVVQEADHSPELFYEVKGLDLGTSMNDQLTFIGCQVPNQSSIPFQFVTQQLTAEQWLVLKLKQSEYDLDWIQKLDSIELLKDYEFEPYFLMRHFKDEEKKNSKPIKIYMPLKKKVKG